MQYLFIILFISLRYPVEWGTSIEVSPTQSSIADVISLKKNMDEKSSTTSRDLILNCETPASNEILSIKLSILLLYRRDDAQISRRAADLRKQLQSDCGSQIKVYIKFIVNILVFI
jgi:hypothetical protein